MLVAAAQSPAPTPTPTLDPHPHEAEQAFVDDIQKDLAFRFPTSADAIKAGYFRYTNEDKTGAISYANLQWQSSDPQHPSQLWYDVNGHLLGADYSVLKANSPARPQIWGIEPGRWVSFPAHVHYIFSGADGESYGYIMAKDFAAGGGDPDNPSATTVVKMGKAASGSQIKRVFLFPSLWDLIVWVLPNPNGAFAFKNPNVIPSVNQGSQWDSHKLELSERVALSK